MDFGVANAEIGTILQVGWCRAGTPQGTKVCGHPHNWQLSLKSYKKVNID